MNAETRLRLGQAHRDLREALDDDTRSVTTPLMVLAAEANIALAQALETLAAVLNKEWTRGE